MTQISPPVARAVSVLNFLAEHAEQAFTLSEIAKSLRISSATCHNLLTALTDVGYLYRTAGKTYVLGPALARVSQAALAPAATMQVARPEMRLLADEFDVVCSASFLIDDKIVVRERASAVSHLNWHKHSSHLLQATALSIAMFLAWDEAAVARWNATAAEPLDEEDVERLSRNLAFLRAHGFTYGVRKVPLVDAQQARELQNQTDLTDHATGIEPKRLYQLAYVVAPVFSQPKTVAFALSLTGFAAPIRGAAIEAMGESLRGACDRIGAFIAGRNLG